MAHIYLAGGWAVQIPTSRDSIIQTIQQAEPGEVVVFEADDRSAGVRRSVQVGIALSQISAVTDEPLPRT